MKRLISIMVFCTALFSVSVCADTQQKFRHFLFIGEPNAAAWKYLMENPQDRKEVTRAAMKEIGGEVLQYWFGLGDGKNYIIVRLPNDNEVIQAVYLMRKPSGLLDSYEVIELMSSAEMVNALKTSKAFLEIEKNLNE